MTERHAIYIRKSLREGLAPGDIYASPGFDVDEVYPPGSGFDVDGGPLTDDPVMREYRFCNVFRELDRVTVWIRENIREPFDIGGNGWKGGPNGSSPHPFLFFMLAIARYINWPPTLAMLMSDGKAWPYREDWNPADMATALEAYAATGAKVYTGAYMIRAESDPRKEWYSWSKHRYISEIVIGRLWRDMGHWINGGILDSEAGLEDVWKQFQHPEYIGWGPFMAYEVVTDLRHTSLLRGARDIESWANAGPGAIRGLNRLHGRPLASSIPAAQATAEMRELLDFARAPGAFPYWFPSDDLEMRDVEHSLCETDKWLRVKSGEGRPRAKFVPGRGF